MPDFPEPRVPIRPVLSFGSFRGRRDAGVPAVDDAGAVDWLTSGRGAIALGLLNAQVGAGDEVLLPAYNCSTMVDAVTATGATPVFYRLQPDLTVDMEDVATRVSTRSRALLVVHFFGFPQPAIAAAQSFCRRSGLLLIEDCAHAWFGACHEGALGSFGDFAVTSAMKFFPVSDGGCLIYPSAGRTPPGLHGAGTGFELKSVLNNLERAVRYGRLQPFTLPGRALLALQDQLWRAIKRRRQAARSQAAQAELGPESSYGGYGIDTAWLHVRMSRHSRSLIRRLPRERMVRIRRGNFTRLLHALQAVPGARPLFPQLPDQVVPYVFPLLVAGVDTVFPVLKRAGVPILRWEDIDRSVCPVSTQYSSQLLQFPCHQEVTGAELEWMIRTITAALHAAGRTAGAAER